MLLTAIFALLAIFIGILTVFAFLIGVIALLVILLPIAVLELLGWILVLTLFACLWEILRRICVGISWCIQKIFGNPKKK